MSIVTALEIRAALLQQGFTCRSWALIHGFNPRTVQKCISTFKRSDSRKVRGIVSTRILYRLSQTLEVDLLGTDYEY